MGTGQVILSSRKLLLFLYILESFYGLYHPKRCNTSESSNAKLLYLGKGISLVIKLFNCFNGRAHRSVKQRPLTNFSKLKLRFRFFLLVSFFFILLCLSGDVETNPGPNFIDRTVSANIAAGNSKSFDNQACQKPLRCLSFNAQSIRSSNKLQDGTFTNNLKSFQDLVYAESLDIILVTETWLNDNFSNNELLPKGYNIIRKDRAVEKRGGGVLIALRDDIPFNKLSAGKNYPNWSDRLEIIAIELELANSKKSLVCVCYRPPSCDLDDWLELFTAFLEITPNYDKVLITGDFNFPDLTWNSTFVSGSTERSISSRSAEFRELIFYFFLQQVNMHPTRLNNILDLILTTASENIASLSCVLPKSVGLSSDHSLSFFDFLLHVKSSGCDKRTVFNYRLADWDGLHDTLRHSDLSPNDHSEIDIDADWKRWKDLFLGAAAKHIPRKTFKRRNTPPWIDSEVKHLLMKKDSYRKKAKRKSCPKLWEKFRELRRVTKSLISTKRKQFFQTLPALLKSSSKKFWSVFKAVSKQSNVPNKMTWSQKDAASSIASNPVDIANLLNRYFSVFKPSDSILALNTYFLILLKTRQQITYLTSL